MLQYEIAKDKCIGCGLCAKDCPVGIIKMVDQLPLFNPEKLEVCIGCQHCLAICPVGALTINGHSPEQSQELKGNLPDADQLAVLMKGRRSVRHYKDENLEPELVEQLLAVARHAPTGVNCDQVRFNLIDDKAHLAIFREEVYTELTRMAEQGELSEKAAMFGNFAKLWQEKGVDILFRGAPHLLVTSVPKSCSTPVADGIITLSYFELYAQSMGVGALWNGFTMWVISTVVPALRQRLGIPEDHEIGYVISFGKPAVSYQRTVENDGAEIVRFKP